MDEVIRKYCPRCGKPGVLTVDGTQDVWTCPATHGEIARMERSPAAPEPEQAAAAKAPAKIKAPTPKPEPPPEPPPEEDDDDKAKKKPPPADEQETDQLEEVKQR